MLLNTSLATCPFLTASISSMYFIQGVILGLLVFLVFTWRASPTFDQEGLALKWRATGISFDMRPRSRSSIFSPFVSILVHSFRESHRFMFVPCETGRDPTSTNVPVDSVCCLRHNSWSIRSHPGPFGAFRLNSCLEVYYYVLMWCSHGVSRKRDAP